MPGEIKVLNAFCGIGGNRALWDQIPGIHITAVDNNSGVCIQYFKNFPQDEVVHGDAYEHITEYHYRYDIIWASPPCPTHSRMRIINFKKKDFGKITLPDMKLYSLVLGLKHFFSGTWVVENVIPYYKPLVEGYRIGRHYFWSNADLSSVVYEETLPVMRKEKITYEAYKQRFIKAYGVNIDGKIYLPDTNGKMRDDTVLRNLLDPRLGLAIMTELLESCEYDEKRQD